MTSKNLIPSHVTIVETGDAVSYDITCKVSSGGTDLLTMTDAYFSISNEIDLEEYRLQIKRTGDLFVNITNRSRDSKAKSYTVTVQYSTCQGSIIYQQKYDTFSKILKDVHTSGLCTQLVLVFNRSLSNLELRPITQCSEEDEWINGLDISCDDDKPIYTIDLTGKFDMYARYLNFLQIDPIDSSKDEKRESLTVNVIAYGFPYIKK